MPDNPWGGHTYSNSLQASPTPKKASRTSKRVASQPTGSRPRGAASSDDDDDNSDSGAGNTSLDPIDFLSSSQAGSPAKQRTKKAAPTKNHSSRSYHTDPDADTAPAPAKEKKPAKRPGNPYSTGFTSKAGSKKTEPAVLVARHRTAATNAHDRLDAVNIDDKPKPAAIKKNDKAFKAAKKSVAKQGSDDESSDGALTKRSRGKKSSQPQLEPFPLDLPSRAPSPPRQLEPAPFPMALPSSSKIPSAARGKPTTQGRLPFDKKNRDSFGLGPDPSPVRAKLLKTRLEAFPMAIPDKPQSSRFPMPSGSKSSPKRSAEDESPQSDRSSKRRKALPDDDLGSSPATPRYCKPRDHDIDPTKLCPFCDEAIPDPSTLSSVYHSLLRAASARSVPVRRRTNPKGLKAPFAVYISVCERHRFESKLLPQAIRMGWPTNVDFDAVPKRLMKRRKELEAILRKPKDNSSFFKEAMDEVAKVGLRVAESAMGQFATFERIQPGYYGERGSVLIHQTLFNMFPPEDMSDCQSSFAPLSIHNFTHAVLLPEAALLLILEDQPAGTTREAALKTMRASSRFGSQMYPDDDDEEGDDDNGRSVGEELMRERAAKRRKEIEEEDRLEEEALRRENERRRQRGEKEIDMELAWTIGVGMLATSGPDPGTGASITSSKSKAKSSKPAIEKDVFDVEASDASVKSTSNKRTKGIMKATASSSASRDALDVDIEMEDVAPTHPAPSSKRRAKPTPSVSASHSEAEMDAEQLSRPPTRQSARTTTKQRDVIRVDDDSESSMSTASKAKRKGKAKEKVTDLTISDSESAAPKRKTTKTSSAKVKPGPASVIAARNAKKAKAPTPPIDLGSSDDEEVENVLNQTPKPNKKQVSRAKPSSSSSSDGSDGDDEDDIDSETLRRLQHKPSSPIRPSFSSQRTPPSSSSLKAIDVRSPSPSENRPISASSKSRAQAGRAGAGGKKTISINPKSVSSSQQSSQALSVGGFSTPTKRSKTRWDGAGNSQSQTHVVDADVAMDHTTPRGVLAQRSNGAIHQQQPYRAQPSDQWLLGNSSPEKCVGSQDAEQRQPEITNEDFDDFFAAEPGSDDFA